ncbi:MAG: 1-deoxy-D-xylulose-5-phosphate synthase [Muribaculaceae bacterium]|nr:1-deoxy-D-xylulose-5-phosphate synthase [Muribaculaceae bacterium]
MLLKDIKNPQDIKSLSIEELEDLADQMRQAILFRTSNIGGHVSPNLGAVEIITAMHYVFNAPEDKLVYDVSHQAFAHKMLTGRAEGYINPEKFYDVDEYTYPEESPEYDIFYAGHTSPSVSLCTGLAKARELKKENHRIVALIGDGSLSGGEALEGLNIGGNVKGNFIVIINDNQMAIAPNFGAMYRSLQALRETDGTSDNNIFKAFGWDYIYLSEGNDMKACIEVLERVKDIDHPIVVHVNTQKGKGYVPAEKYREEFHSHNPYDIATGNLKEISEGESYSNVLKDFLLQKLEDDKDLLIVSSATPEEFGFMEKERELAGKQFIDVDIAEQSGVSVMSGAARGGAKVVYPICATFMQRAYDQLIEDWAMDNSPALLPVLLSGIRGINDKTHLGFWDIPFLSSMPEIIYLAPANVEELKAMLEWGYRQDQYKVAVRVPTYSFEHSDYDVDDDYSDINKIKIIRKGERVAIIGAGDFYVKAKQVADLLKQNKDINATLINPRFVSGVDVNLLNELKKDHELVVTIEDGSLEGGFGERIASVLGPSDLRVMNFGLAKKFENRYRTKDLEAKNNLLPEQIANQIIGALS